MTEQELVAMYQEMTQEERVWFVGMVREARADAQADRMLAEALGPEYEPMDPAAWRPSTLPPGCATWAEFEARIRPV